MNSFSMTNGTKSHSNPNIYMGNINVTQRPERYTQKGRAERNRLRTTTQHTPQESYGCNYTVIGISMGGCGSCVGVNSAAYASGSMGAAPY